MLLKWFCNEMLLLHLQSYNQNIYQVIDSTSYMDFTPVLVMNKAEVLISATIIESVKNTSMENACAGVLDKKKGTLFKM